MTEHREKIKRIRDELEREGWRCGEEMPVGRNGSTGKIDLCCEKFNTLFCLEVEDKSSKEQILENERDLDRMKEEARRKGKRYGKCHISVKDDWRGRCGK